MEGGYFLGFAQEKGLEMGKDDLDGKPDNIKEKIVAGKHSLLLLFW